MAEEQLSRHDERFQAEFALLIDLLPLDAIINPSLSLYMEYATADEDRYVLQRLDYSGDFLESRLRQSPVNLQGGPGRRQQGNVRVEVCDQTVARLRDMAWPKH